MRKLLLAILLTGMLGTSCKKDKNNDVDKATIEYFNANLKADMKYDEMESLFGKPAGDLGSGVHMYFYVLSDRSTILIGYADKILYARHMSPTGQLLHTII